MLDGGGGGGGGGSEKMTLFTGKSCRGSASDLCSIAGSDSSKVSAGFISTLPLIAGGAGGRAFTGALTLASKNLLEKDPPNLARLLGSGSGSGSANGELKVGEKILLLRNTDRCIVLHFFLFWGGRRGG